MQSKILAVDNYFRNFNFQEQGTGCVIEQEPESDENDFFASAGKYAQDHFAFWILWPFWWYGVIIREIVVIIAKMLPI